MVVALLSFFFPSLSIFYSYKLPLNYEYFQDKMLEESRSNLFRDCIYRN